MNIILILPAHVQNASKAVYLVRILRVHHVLRAFLDIFSAIPNNALLALKDVKYAQTLQLAAVVLIIFSYLLRHVVHVLRFVQHALKNLLTVIPAKLDFSSMALLVRCALLLAHPARPLG